MRTEDVIIAAHVKEKALSMMGSTADPEEIARSRNQNKLVFTVHRHATKGEIRKAAEELLGVKVIKVNTFQAKDGKRAIVKLHPSSHAEAIREKIGAF